MNPPKRVISREILIEWGGRICPNISPIVETPLYRIAHSPKANPWRTHHIRILITRVGHMASDQEDPISDELNNALEAAINLVYLIRADRSDSEKVLQWADLAASQLQRIA